MLSELLVKKSPSPPRQRNLSMFQQTARTTTTATAPVFLPYERTQSLNRHENYRHVRHYPKTLEIFIPTDQTQPIETKITRTYEVEVEKRKRSSSAHQNLLREQEKEIEREYIRCLNDVTDEFERRQRQKMNKFEIKEQFETFEQTRRFPTKQTDEQTNYQRSLSEGLLHQRIKPATTYDITISDDELTKMEYRLQAKERLKPIRIHSSNNSLPGETSIKYVRTEAAPVEIRLPKPQIITNQGEHSSTIVKDVRQMMKKVTTNIHQNERRKTIEGIHELKVIEAPIRSEQTRPVEFTVPKPIETLPAEHTSTLVVKSKKGGRFQTLDISSSLGRQRTLSGEHELRIVAEPIRSTRENRAVELLFPKLTLPSSSTHHSATVVKQTRTPQSSLIFENIQTRLKGEHQLRRVEQPIQSGPADSVELIVPKSVTDVAEHSTTMVTETQPHRRVLEVTGSGKSMQSEHERKYYHDVVRVEEALEVKLPKNKIEQVEHSTTVVKHSRGHPSIIEVDNSGKIIEGEHELRIVEQSVETKADAMQLLIPKPQVLAEHSTTIIKGTRGKSQVVAFERTQPIPGEHQTKFYDQPVEALGEIEVLFPKQNQTKPTISYDHLRSSGEQSLTMAEHLTEMIENEEIFERIGEHSTTLVKQTRAKYEPVELVVDRPTQLPSVATVIADIQGERQITSIRPSTVHLTEESSVQLDLDLTHQERREQYDEMELVLEKPILRDSSTTVLANVQPGLELKSIQATLQPITKKVIEESTSSFTLKQDRETEEELLELRLRKPHVQDSSSILLAAIQPELGVQGPLKASPYVPQPIEESTTALTMDLAYSAPIAPVELIIPRLDVESSSSTILAQVSPAIAGLRARIDVPTVEKSTSNYIFEQKRPREEEVELIMPKPKRLEKSSSTMIADVQATLEMKDIRPSEVPVEAATSTFFFDQTTSEIVPEPVELRFKPPTIADSSTTLLAHVRATLDTDQVHVLGSPHLPYESSTSEFYLETYPDARQPSEVELILPRPQVEESTSVVLADVRATLDTSERHLVLPPPPPIATYSTSEILETDQSDSVPVELHFHRQPSSHSLVATLDDKREKFRETYILGTNQSQEQPYEYQVNDGSSVLHVDLNKPVELVFNVDGTTASSTTTQQRRDYSTRMLTSNVSGIDNTSTMITDSQPRQYQPVEFLVTGGNLSGYNTSVGSGGYTTTRTTTTTTRRAYDSSNPNGYDETTNTSVIQGIRPYDQVDLIIQPDSSYSSSSKVLSTSVGLDQSHAPYFVLSLHDQSIREGNSVLFEVIVSAQPAPEIVWDKDGDLITDDSAFRIEYFGDGRATLYIPEVFFDDEGYYTCTASNSLGTCRTTARLTIEGTGESETTNRRSRYDTVYYQRQASGPRQIVESYRYYSPPKTNMTRVTNETQYYQVPSQPQHSEITYSIQGTQQKFQPVQFLVTANQDNTQQNVTTTIEDQSVSTNPYELFGAHLRTRPFQSNASSYGDDNTSVTTTTRTMTTTYSQQPPYGSQLRPTVAKQPGPSYSQTDTHDLESMQTESDISSIHLVRSAQQPTTSYITSRPTFSKPLETIDAVENATVQITVHFSTLGITHTRPHIEWFHHGQPIIPDNEHYRIVEDSETSTLEIIHLRKSDAGQVWCVATTPSGSATTTCTINVADRPTRTYRRTVTTTQQQQVVPYETTYETHSAHADIDLHHQQVPTASHYYSSQTLIQPQQQHVPTVTTSTTTYSHQQEIPLHSNIPQAPPLLPDFNQRTTYSSQKIIFLNGGLKDTPLYSGTETVIECQFSGQPEKIQWFRNEVEIINNPQQFNNRMYHVTNLSTGTTRLIINPTFDEDAGTYTVKITGPHGEETSTAKLIPATQYQNMQKKKLEQVQRKALVQELEEKQLKRMRPSKGSVTAVQRGSLTYATSDDDVFYDTTQTTAPRRQPTAPHVTRPLKDMDVKEGQPIQISCQIQGFPKSEIIWLRNNVPLPLSQRHKVAYDSGSGTITLRINESRPEDSGVYTVIARNPQGQVYTTARIDVQETPGIDETSYVQPDAFKYIEKQPTTSRSPSKPRRESDTSSLSQQRPAKILKTPMNTTVVEGDVAQFLCQVEGTPKPKIAWLKNNKPLMAGPRFNTYFDQPSRTAVLRISDVSKDDQGYYTCIVDNPLNSDRSTATLQVLPQSKVDQRSYVEVDAFKYLAPEKKQGRIGSQDTDRMTSGVDSESYVNPESFRYLENKRPIREVEDSATIDDRPIVDLEAFRYLEARQAHKVKKRDDTRSSIDETPIIAPDAFRYLEKRVDAAKAKKVQDTGPSIDETPQVDLTAFQYLERRAIPKKPEEQGPSIDESSIVNPEAFLYLERKPMKKKEDVGPLIDESPMVNPDAFRYLERQTAPRPRDTTPMIDTTPLVNPEVFKYLERPSEMPRIDEGPVVDTRPIVPQEAFRWLERPQSTTRAPEGPAVDESSYVNPSAFRYIEAKPKSKVVDQGPTVDETSYVNPQAFRYLEAPTTKKKVDEGPAIDTSNYVNPELFAQFERKLAPAPVYEEQEVKRSPRVVQPLKNTQVYEGKPVVLVAVIDGFPVPQLTWLKDGTELPASTRVTTNYDIPSRTAWIRIDNARPDDTAVYTLLAHNPAGDVRSDARLIIVPSSTPIDDTSFVPVEAFARVERPTGPLYSTMPATTGVDDTSFVNPELFRQFEVTLQQPKKEDYTDEMVIQVPARFLVPLRPVQAPENSTVVLDAIVEGTPVPTFNWLKDQMPLKDSHRFITNYDLPTKRVTLTIKDVRENDTGTYTLLASNGPQLQHSSAVVQIIGAPTIDQSSFIPMDVFRQLERPLNQTSKVPVQAGVDMTSFVAQPDRFAAFDMIQPNRRPLNDFGGVDETPLGSMEKIRLLEIPSRVTKRPDDAEEKVQAPVVLAPLQPIDTQEGTPVVLTAKIDGSPMPNFTWFKDDQPLVASARFTTYYDVPSKLIILQIGDARPNDTGVYTVKADNKAGDVTTSAQLTVTPSPSIREQGFIPTDKFRQFEQGNIPRFVEDVAGVDERPLVDLTKLRQLEIKPTKLTEEVDQEQKKPTVIIPLRNTQAAETQPVVLSAQIDGKPQPQFTWFKNDQPLAEGNRFRTHYDIPSKTVFLTIAGAREDDSGTYRLVAKNPSGEDETSCDVTVDLNQPKIDQRSFVPHAAFERLEKPTTKPLDVTSGVDQTSFFNQELFRPFDERTIKHPSAFVGGEDSDAAMPISAPRVLVPLRPLAAPEGQAVLFTTQVEGYPLPQFTWFHNDKPLMASNRITSHYDMLTKRCYLQVLDTRPDDAGTYELLAENPAGQDRTRTELTIIPVSKIDQTGYVPYDKFSTLEFKPRLPSDLRSGVDATPFVSGEIFRLLEAKPINLQYQPNEEQNVPLEVIIPLKPAVAQEGQPVILTTKIRGRPIPQFTWLRNNEPLLESTRFQTHYDFPSETLVLEVSDIWPHDSGLYTVIAENPKTGERVETSAPLTIRTDATLVDRTAFVSPDSFRNLEEATKLRTNFVQPGVDTNSFLTPEILRALEQGKPMPMDTNEKEQPLTPPKVIVPMKPVNCNEGQPIIFTAKVEGNPQPMFTWFKNGQPLQESNRFWSHYDIPSKTVLLQINGARPDDVGTYALVAENPLGHDQTQANVNVSSGPAIDTNPFVSPDKFAAFDQPMNKRSPVQSGVDSSPFVQPERFAQLELKAPAPTKEDMDQLEAPHVIVPLQSIQLKEGAPALLRAKIVGRPTPTFSWLKDNAPLAASNRLRTRYDIGTKQVLLQINDVRPHDVGEYCVVAKNPAGEDSTVCSLTVVPDRPGVDDRAFVPQDRFRGLEHPEGQRRPLEIVPGVDMQPFIEPERFLNLKPIPPKMKPEDELKEPKRAPKVIVPLVNTDMEEQMPVIFTTTIDAGYPMATFEWFKNGQPLREGNRFTTKYDILSKVLTLQILAARPDDQGTYTVRATNPSGADETSCQLTIRPTTSIDTRPFVQPEKFANLELKAPPPTKEDLAKPEPPKVVIPLEDTQLKEGAPALLSAKIIGRPTPDFVWLKDNKPLSASNRLRTRYDIGTKQVLLQINDVRPDDVGEYRVIATNPAGQASTNAKLNVVPDRRGVDSQPFIEPEKFLNLKPIPATTRPEDELTEPKRAPKVIVPLSDTDMEEQMPVIFTTTIDAGVPMATFEWFKDGQPLREGNRFTTKYDILSKVLTLQILAARPDDQGTYTVKATNPSGQAETSCKLNIRPTTSIDTRPYVEPAKFSNLELKAPPPTKEDLAKPEPPKVVIPLEDTQLKEGSPVLLTAKIIGRPTPDFVWLKDNKPLQASNRLRTRYDIGTKQVLLQINDVRPDDVGEYRVIATNPAGQASTVCKLNVVPDRRGVDNQPFIEPEKFLNLKPIPATTRPEDESKEPKRPPKVIVPLTDTDMEEQMPVIFTTTIDAGVPMATFEWFKDGQPLREANRFTTKYDILSKVLTLQILATRPDDQGTYTVRATNPSGKAETSCKLNIRPTTSIDTRPFVEPERFTKLELKAPPPSKEDLAKPEPPKVIIPLEDTQLKEGAPALLTAKIIGRPTPDFIWLKDNQPLNASNRLRTRYDIGTKQVLLQINDVRPDDVGEYRVVATNPAGQASTAAKLSVVPDRRGVDSQPFIEPERFLNLRPIPPKMKPEDELKEPKRPPKVIVPLSDTDMEEQMPVIFTTTIDAGVPMATFEWFKDGQPLREGNRFTTKYDILPKLLTLQILAARPDDQGTYTVRASNPSGKDETSCKLTIRPTTSIDTRPFVEPAKFANLELKAPPPTKEDLAKPEPPKVIIPLEDTQLKEGVPALLTAKIIGRPTPDFVWLKDNQPLQASNRLRTRYDIGTKQVLLQINDVRPDDVGEYRVVATNPAGQASTAAKLSVVPDRRGVDSQPFIEPERFLNLRPIPPKMKPEDELKEPKRPPKVIVPLSDTDMEEQMPVIFTTTIDAGVPMATFEWFKDGQPLREGNRFTTKYDILNKVLTLNILASRPDDQGTYTVRASNPVGKDETSCKLSIRPTTSIDTRPFVQPEKFANLEVKAPPPTKEDMQKMEPPKVIIPLEDTQLKEGVPALLTAKIIGRPTPDFVWLKDNKPLQASNRLRTRYDIGTKQVLLQINDVRPDDVGEYRVVATNPAGQASTQCKLNIIPDRRGVDSQPFIEPEKFLNLKPIPATTRPEDELKEPKRPPKVIVPLADTVMEEMMPVIFTTTIDAGVPMATFEWFKDGQPLREANRFTTKYDILNKVLTLHILASRPDDQGTYTVKATNPVGKDETSCKLTIKPTASIDTRPFVEPEKFAPLEVKAPPPTKEDLQKMEPPKVIIPLEDMSLKEGAPALLQSKIIGRPTPDFVWLKDNKPLPASNRLRTRYDIGTKQVLLQINDVRPDDVGEYRVVATNPAGQASTQCKLNIIPDRRGVDNQPFIEPEKFLNLKPIPPKMKPEDELKEPKRPPKVIVPLADTVMEEMMPVIFTTTIDAGVPMATFEWFKDGQPLREANRFTTKYDILNKVLTLHILASRPDDQGVYTVKATNPVGKDETSCKLTIKPTASIDTRPFVEPEKFAPLEVKAPPPTKEDLQKMEPPKVIIPLEDMSLKEGAPALLQSKIIGQPTPDFVWLKDNKPLQASNRLRTRYDIGTKQVLLQINDVRPDDVGEYRVVATNPAGQASTQCKLNIIPDRRGVDSQPFIEPEKFLNLKPIPPKMKPEDELKEPKRPPKVIVPLADTVMEEMMPVIFTTTIDAGVPMATFEWFKDGQPLREGNRFTTKYDILNRVLTLHILASRPDDQGTYTVKATNPVGKDETSCKLTIKPTASIDTRPFVQPEKFAPLEVKAPPPTKEDLQKMEPPKVIIPLEDMALKEGAPALLQSKIIGRPTPDFVWLKDNKPLQASNRLRTRYDIGTKQVLLQINDVRPDDVGEYRVVATNPAGQASTQCKLNIIPDRRGVDNQPFIEPEKFLNLKPIPSKTQPEDENAALMRPPKVIVPLVDSALEEMMPVILTATVDAGVPMATFTWLKNGQPLLEGNRFTTTYDIGTRTITLQILASRPDDQGTYTVRAVNPVGSDETSCKLTIRPTSSIDTRPFVDGARFRPLEGRPQQGVVGPDGEELLRPPKVLIPMNNVRLTESEPILLKSIIDAGHPMGQFTWLKDGRPLVESNRYRANYDINTRTATLFIDSARPSTDTGRYTVHVENIVGKDQTTGEVNVDGTPGIDSRPFVEPSKFGKFDGLRGPVLQPLDSLRDRENLPPWIRLTKDLDDQDIDETKAAQLICGVDAHPAATINWFKEGSPLIVSQRFIPTYDQKTCVVCLTIYPVYAADSGNYSMVARNIAGEVTTKCTLRIQPTANVEENPLVKFTGLRKTPQQPAALGTEPAKMPTDLDEGQKPYFIKVPVDREVPEGQLVRLDYIPAGRPEPTLTWYRNGVPLKPNDADHRDVINEGGVHSLLVLNPKLGPPVEYKCVAKNKYGEASFPVRLNVVDRGANIAPFFIEQLYDIIIIEGQDARLDACAQGFPEPNVAWEKEGQPLTPNKEYKIELEGPRTTLFIRGAKMTDAGFYQCTATSPAGTAITKCRVTVIPLSEAGQYAKDLPQFGPQTLNKVPVLPEDDIRSKYMTVPVKPPEVRPEDLYKLPKRAKKTDNPLDDVKRRGLKVLPDEVLSAITQGLEEYPEEEMYSKDRPQPPKFKVHIKSQLNLNEDDHCIFEAKLIPVRDPMMRVQWFKNGKVLHHASRIIPKYDFADVSLEFLWTFAEDDGIYECVATNPYGEDRTRAELKCRPKRSIIYNTQLPEGMEGVSKLQMLEDEMRYTASMIGLEEKVQEKEAKAPEFIMNLEDLTVDEGDNAKFIVKVDGHPRPRLTWSINDVDIANGSRYKLVFDGLVHYLDIPRTRQYDAGTIRCVAKNSLGQSESVATLNLRLRQDYRSGLSKVPGGIETGLDDSFDVDIEERLRVRSQNRQRDSVDDRARRPSTDRLHPLHSKALDRMTWKQTEEKVGEAPNFTKPLLPLKAKEGSKVVVSVEFTGTPPPTVSWYRDGFMVEDSEDFKIQTTATQSILSIKHAFIIDSGLYTVKLFNPIGIKQCQAAIRILPIIAEDQTPRFLDVPQNTEILAGDPVRFQCRVEGEPFPTVAFYREDEPVDLTDKRFRVIQEVDVFTLLLFEALPADSGQYEAVAENSVGKANTRFTLTVVPREPDGKKASIMDDPKLIHKVPYLEKPLEDLRVKEGQSATFECIIPASFGSDVKWYKGTSEWPIKPSKFFKPKSDGTKHQLFILEAYAEDEGLYKCVVSNPVGTTATTATLKVDHNMQVPEFVRGFSNLTTYEGEQVRFEVEVRGDPTPTITWYRDGELIRDSPDFQIFTEGNRSLFYISEVFMEDQGLFTCTASNSAGSSDCSARLTVEPRPQQ